MVTWERDTSGECPVENRGKRTFTNGYFSYTIEQLEENSNYTITLAAINAAGSAVSDPVTGLTKEAGGGYGIGMGIFVQSFVCCVLHAQFSSYA